MRRIATYLVLSLFLSLGTGYAYADRSHDRPGQHREQRDNKGKKNDKKHNNKGHDKKGDKKFDKKGPHQGHQPGMRPGPGQNHQSAPRPGGGSHPGVGAPRPGFGPGPVSAPRPGHSGPVYYDGPMPPRLQHMVHHASHGGKIVNVWRVDYDTYVVQYRKGRKYYTQYIYPYADRYGAPALINVNWTPPTPWSLIPAIQLNINL